MSIAPSPLSTNKTKAHRALLLSETLSNSVSHPSSHLDRAKALLVEESPMAITPDLSDESETRKKRKSNEGETPTSGEKRKYVEDDEDSESDESLLQPFANRPRDRVMRIQELGKFRTISKY